MGRGFTSRARTYVKNVGVHFKRFAAGKESVGEVLSGIASDARKLTHSVTRPVDDDHREAARLTEHGRRAYNQKDYKSAEDCFKRALLADQNYTLALTYLGHTLYMQGLMPEAVTCWKRAVAIDPKSEAADMARRKLERVEVRENRAVDQIEQRIRDRG